MSRKIRGLVMLAVVWLSLTGAQAAERKNACPPALTPPSLSAGESSSSGTDHGMLWRLRRDGVDSFLFASLHIGKPAWSLPGPALSQALQQTEVLALELDLSDPQTLAELARPRPLARPLPAVVQARLRAQTAAACLPKQALAALHPLLQVGTLTMLAGRWDGLDAAFGQEAMLLGWAQAQRVPVLGLEQAEQQMQALIPDDAAEVERSLAEALAQLEQGSVRAPMLRLAQAWARGDLAELQNYERWCDCVHTARDRAWLRRLNDARNPHLAARIAALHGGGRRLLAAVGALHMTGPQALPLLLEGMGFEVTRVVGGPGGGASVISADTKN